MFDRFPMLPMLPAADLERARRWYEDRLGISPTNPFPEQELNLYARFVSYKSQYAGTAKNTAAMWVADDFDAALAHLRDRGVELKTYDMPELDWDNGVASAPNGARTVWFEDSEGNVLSVVEPPAGVRPQSV